jgi:DNA-binding NarL/FixJ family response regulator
VGAVVYYSKHPALSEDLNRCLRRIRGSDTSRRPVRLSVRSTGRSERQWRVRDRLTGAEIGKIVALGREGVSKVQIAEQFKISHSSVKRILAVHGVRYGAGRYKRL